MAEYTSLTYDKCSINGDNLGENILAKKQIPTRVQKILIKNNSNKLGKPDKCDIEKSNNDGITYGDYFKQIDELSLKARSLYNEANYIIRQKYFETRKEKEAGLRDHAVWLRYNELDPICRDLAPYGEKPLNDFKSVGCSGIAQHTIKILDRNWKSFFKSIKDYKENPNKYKEAPKPARYMKDNKRVVVELTSNQVKNKDGYVFFSLSSFKNFNNTFKLRNPNERIYSARFVPVGTGKSKVEAYVFEIIQVVDVPNIESVPTRRIAGIDLGVNNLAAIATNCGVNPIAINGRPLKSINAYYNKKLATMKSELKKKNDKDWSKRLTNFAQKRNRRVEDYIHKASAKIVSWCVENNIDTVVCGHNTDWKQESNMGATNNQNFTYIPHSKLIQKIKYKCENNGIRFIETEEGYTSGTSFLDGEDPIKENYNKSRRLHRGMFVSNSKELINADVNGAYQIIKKAFPDAYNVCDEFARHPIIINIE